MSVILRNIVLFALLLAAAAPLGAQAPAFSSSVTGTAIFSFAIVHHPDRLPPADTREVKARAPARFAYLAALWRGEDPPTSTLAEPVSRDAPTTADRVSEERAMPAPKASRDDEGQVAWILQIIAALLLALLIAKVGLIVFLVRWRRSQSRREV